MKKMTSFIRLAVLASLGFSSHSMAMQAFDEGKTIIKFGVTDTKLSQSLSEDYQMEYFAAYGAGESKAQIEANVAAAEFVYVNLKDFHGKAQQLNEYLAEAVKQKKLVVLENGQFWNQVSLKDFPYSSTADITLFKAGYYGNANKAIVYGGSDIIKRTLPTQSFVEVPGEHKMVEVKPLNAYVEPAKIIPGRFSKMESEQLSRALSKVKASITELTGVSIASGVNVDLGFEPCPDEATEQKLCSQTLTDFDGHITDFGENSDWSGGKTIIRNQVFTGIYRTAEKTWAVVIPYGQISSILQNDDYQERGFFLDKQHISMNLPAINDPDREKRLTIHSLKPEAANGVTRVVSTSGLTYGIKAGTPGKPNDYPWLQGSITFQSSKAVSYDIVDWLAVAKDTSLTDVLWKNELSRYKTAEDWVTRGFMWWPTGFHEVPAISKERLSYSGELVLHGLTTLEEDINIEFTATTTGAKLYWQGWNNPAKAIKTEAIPYSVSLPFYWLKHPSEVPES